MQAHLQCIEGQGVADLEQQRTMEDEACLHRLAQEDQHCGEVPTERMSRLRPQLDVGAVPKGEAAEPSHFGSNCHPGSSGSDATSFASIGGRSKAGRGSDGIGSSRAAGREAAAAPPGSRRSSEERHVGKEGVSKCRSRWATYN